jgi:hypothetical protein
LLAIISPTKPKIASLTYPLGFLAQLVRVCEESKNMMNKTLVEDRIDGSSNFSSWKSRLQITLEEDDLLWVIQNYLPETTTNEEKEERRKMTSRQGI